MVLKLAGLVKRGEVWIYRRTVPPKLRPVVEATEVKRTLGTGDLDQAQERWRAVKAEVERSFAEGQRAPSSTVFSLTLQETSPLPSLIKPVHDDSDNPSLSVTFARYYAERKPDELGLLQIRIGYFGRELYAETERLHGIAESTRWGADRECAVAWLGRIMPLLQQIVEALDRIEALRQALGPELLRDDIVRPLDS